MFSTFQLLKVIAKSATTFKIYNLHSYFAHELFSPIKSLMPVPFSPLKIKKESNILYFISFG